ncbi:uncharacterized protein PS065_000015 [Dugong dugon]
MGFRRHHPARSGHADQAQTQREIHWLGAPRGEPEVEAQLAKAPPTPVAKSARPRARAAVGAVCPHGRSRRGPGRAARSGRCLPASARRRHAARGRATRLAHLAAGARGGSPALGVRHSGRRSCRAVPAHRPAALRLCVRRRRI